MESNFSKELRVVLERLDPRLLENFQSFNESALTVAKKKEIMNDVIGEGVSSPKSDSVRSEDSNFSFTDSCPDYPGRPKINSRVMQLKKIILNEKHTKPFLFDIFQLKECDIVLERINIDEYLKKECEPSNSEKVDKPERIIEDVNKNGGNSKITIKSSNHSIKNKIKKPEYTVTFIQPPSFNFREQPYNLECSFCHKKYNNEKKLNNHISNKHDVVNKIEIRPKKKVSFSDVVEIIEIQQHRCRKCLRLFEDYNTLRMHMKAMHKKRDKYICDYCQILFAERAVFKVHIRLHCDKCGGLFSNKMENSAHKKNCKGKTKADIPTVDLCYKEKSQNDTSPSIVNTAKHIDYSDIQSRVEESVRKYFETIAIEKEPRVMLERVKLPKKPKPSKTLTNNEYRMKPVNLFTDFTSPSNKNVFSLGNSASQQNLFKPNTSLIKGDTSFTQRMVFKDNNYVLKGLLNRPVKPFTNVDSKSFSVKNKFNTFAHNSGVKKNTMNLWNSGVTKTADKKNKMCNTKPFYTTNQTKPCHNTFNYNSIFSQKRVHCEICNTYFTDALELEAHKRSYHNAQVFQCPRCEEQFVWESLLLSHRCILDYNRQDDNLGTPDYAMPQSMRDAGYVYAYEVPIEF